MGQYLTASPWEAHGQPLPLPSISFPSISREKYRSFLWLTALSSEKFKPFTRKWCLGVAEDSTLVQSKPSVVGWGRRQVCRELRSYILISLHVTISLLHGWHHSLPIFSEGFPSATCTYWTKSHTHFPLPIIKELHCQGEEPVGCWGQRFVFLQLLRQAGRGQTQDKTVPAEMEREQKKSCSADLVNWGELLRGTDGWRRISRSENLFSPCLESTSWRKVILVALTDTCGILLTSPVVKLVLRLKSEYPEDRNLTHFPIAASTPCLWGTDIFNSQLTISSICIKNTDVHTKPPDIAPTQWMN